MGRTAFFSGLFAASWNRQVAFYGQGKFLVYSEYVEFRFWVPRAGYPNIQDILMVFFFGLFGICSQRRTSSFWD